VAVTASTTNSIVARCAKPSNATRKAYG
jgi:hypothetical protein